MAIDQHLVGTIAQRLMEQLEAHPEDVRIESIGMVVAVDLPTDEASAVHFSFLDADATSLAPYKAIGLLETVRDIQRTR